MRRNPSGAEIPLPNGPFDVIYADPPWRFASNSEARPGRNPMRHYQCMTLSEIAEMPIVRLASPSALLLMWVTVPFAAHAHDVMRAWGFTYKSQVVWIKDRIGMGYWARNRHELLYIGTRGGFPCPEPTLFPDSVVVGQQRAHSRKPDAVHQIIDDRFGHLRRIELFARAPRKGWSVFGNETNKFSEVG